MTVSAAIIIPTRDRADLAIGAIRSLLAIADPRLLHVIISNNSSEPEHVRSLAEYCERSADPRLIHLRPPRPLPMAEHWDWAIGEAMAQSPATHLALHYDRRVSKPELSLLFDVAEQRPDLPVTYPIDVVYEWQARFFALQMKWSGGAYEIRTSRALDLASRGLLTDLWQAFPVLVNCLTPRSALESVRCRFGSFCASTTPESCFGFRYSAIADTYVHFDRPLGIHYGSGRSNGLGYIRGETSAAFGDFLKLHGDRPWLDAAPIPGLSLGQNIFYHEYMLARREVGQDRFPPVEMDGYLKDIARGLLFIGDPGRRSEMRELLVSHGWEGEAGLPAPPRRPPLRERLRAKMDRLRADHLSARPEYLSTIGFGSETRALRCAAGHSRAATPDNAFLSPLEPVRLQ
jgi:hypothetical protein